MGLAEVAGAGKEAATDGGIVEVVVVFVKAVASEFEVVMGFEGGVFDFCVVAVVDEVVKWFDVVGDKLLLDVFDERTFNGNNVPAVVCNFLETVEGFGVEVGVEARKESMNCVRFKSGKANAKVVLNNIVDKFLDAVCKSAVRASSGSNSAYFVGRDRTSCGYGKWHVGLDR